MKIAFIVCSKVGQHCNFLKFFMLKSCVLNRPLALVCRLLVRSLAQFLVQCSFYLFFVFQGCPPACWVCFCEQGKKIIELAGRVVSVVRVFIRHKNIFLILTLSLTAIGSRMQNSCFPPPWTLLFQTVSQMSFFASQKSSERPNSFLEIIICGLSVNSRITKLSVLVNVTYARVNWLACHSEIVCKNKCLAN